MSDIELSANTESVFKDIYFHLYSNSSAVRSERILADLAKIILFLSDRSKGLTSEALENSISRGDDPNLLLLEHLQKTHPDVVRQGDQFSIGSPATFKTIELMKSIDFGSDTSHFLGDAFQALMGPRIRGDKGQFFTPRNVVSAITNILEIKAGDSIIDPACGTGGFLGAAAFKCQNVDNLKKTEIVGIEKDSDTSYLAKALLSNSTDNIDLTIKTADALDIEAYDALDIKLGSFDRVVTNPPFGAKIAITNQEILKNYSLSKIWTYNKLFNEWQESDIYRESQDPQVLFLELCIRLLKKGGKMGIVLPEGMFGNAKSGYIWDYLRSWGTIDALLDCPRTTFQPGTDTKTNVLFFTKREYDSSRKHEKSKAWVSVAYQCGHDRRGRTLLPDGQKVPNDFQKISEDWSKTITNRKFWSHSDLIDKYYLVPRYYDGTQVSRIKNIAKSMSSPTVSLQKLVDGGHLHIRKGHEVGSQAYGTGEIPFIRTSDIQNFEISADPTKSVSETVYLKYRRQQNLKSGDILMVVDGRYKIGRCGILYDWNTTCVVQSHLKIISIMDGENIEPEALLYALSLPEVQNEIRRLVFIQSTLGGLGKRIGQIILPDPRFSDNWGKDYLDFKNAVIGRSRLGQTLSKFYSEAVL